MTIHGFIVKFIYRIPYSILCKWENAVAQLGVEALLYKAECRGFDSRYCHWNFSLT
jgi:hypothetical protein